MTWDGNGWKPEEEQFDHYKDQAVILPPGTFIEVDGDVYQTTATGRGYSTTHKAYLPELIWRYNFNIIAKMGKRKWPTRGRSLTK